jgi:hypothetical protein
MNRAQEPPAVAQRGGSMPGSGQCTEGSSVRGARVGLFRHFGWPKPLALVPNLITARGIEVYGAEAPSGTHYIRVEVKDNVGRVDSIAFPLMVAD